MSLDSSQTLSHYRLIEKIGRGGMGVVWKAKDTILDRVVAIKVLPADLRLDEQRRNMFLAEARRVASISHAHVVEVHELGREGDLDFIVMEFVDGQSLSEIMRGRPLSTEKVVRWALQVAEGLSRAHRCRFIHRDLKPANILVTTEGDIKIVDFGLATLMSSSETSTVSVSVSKTGEAKGVVETVIAGTLPYMSPEQVRGEKLDGRSDIYSLGVILYEMTTGRKPFLGETPADVAKEILTSNPVAVPVLVPKVPLDLHRIIEKAMVRRASDRYQTIDDLAVDLRRLTRDLDSGTSASFDDMRAITSFPRARRWWTYAAVFAAIITILVVWWRWPWNSDNFAPRETRSIAVSPLEVRGPIEGADYVGRAFAEAVALNLAIGDVLRVLPVASDDPIRPQGDELARMHRERGIDLLLCGSLIREGKSSHLQLTLIDVAQDRIVWGTTDHFEVGQLHQAAVSTSNQLATWLDVVRPKLYDYLRYVSGSKAMAGWPDLPITISALRNHDVPQALELTERLVEAFPEEYEARVMRLTALVDYNNMGESEHAARIAMDGLAELERVDPNCPIVALFAAQSERAEGLLEQSYNRYQTLIRRNDLTPALRAHALREFAFTLGAMDSLESAAARMQEALRLDPANSFNYLYFSPILVRLGDYDKAEIRVRQAIALDPFMWLHHRRLATILEAQERMEEAAEAWAQCCEMEHSQYSYARLARCLYLIKRIDEALEAAQRAVEAPSTSSGAYALAQFKLLVDDRNAVLHYLRRAMELGLDPNEIAQDSTFVALRGIPEFETLVSQPSVNEN